MVWRKAITYHIRNAISMSPEFSYNTLSLDVDHSDTQIVTSDSKQITVSLKFHCNDWRFQSDSVK